MSACRPARVPTTAQVRAQARQRPASPHDGSRTVSSTDRTAQSVKYRASGSEVKNAPRALQSGAVSREAEGAVTHASIPQTADAPADPRREYARPTTAAPSHDAGEERDADRGVGPHRREGKARGLPSWQPLKPKPRMALTVNLSVVCW